MAGISGTFTAAAAWNVDNPFLSEDLNELTEVVSKFDVYALRWTYVDASFARRLHQANRWAVSAQMRGQSFFDDFYNRIYIIPGSLDVGNLLSTQTRQIVLWNAYTTPGQTLQAAQLGPQAGLSLTLPAGVVLPYEMNPLRELTFTLQIEIAGPPTIDSYLDFTVEGTSYRVPIVGRRIVLFPFAPNWGSPVDETITMRSWVLPAEDGSEQTGSESGQIPRRTLEYNINLRTAVQAQRCENLLFAWQSRFFGVPHWGEEERTTGALSAGSLTIPFNTFGMSLEPGSLVVLYQDEDKNEIREVESVAVDGVTLTTALQYEWPLASRVYPCFVGLMSEAVSGSRETSRVGRMPVMFDCEPSVTPGNVALTTAPLTYRGKELYLGKVNWLSAMPFSFTSDVQRVDANVGRFMAFSSSGFSKMSRRHNWTLFNRADIFSFRQFLGRRQGVARSVFMPSGTEDFILVQQVLDTEVTLVVTKNDYGTLAGAHPARRDIIIQMNNGSYYCRRITGTSDFENTTRLQIDSSLGVTIQPSDVKQISFLTLYRQESPSTTIRHLTDSKATVDAMLVAKTTED